MKDKPKKTKKPDEKQTRNWLLPNAQLKSVKFKMHWNKEREKRKNLRQQKER